MKGTLLSIIAAAILIGGALVFTRSGDGTQQAPNVNNVSIVDGTQIIEIKAKGGYLPRKSVAKAGVPTIIRFDTNGTFDCSSSVRIPSMNISKVLPQTGSTDIDIGIQPVATLDGICGMGMYPFEIDFQS
ncbi:MAG: hypothetical protein A2675_04105 [Candidatus Yonathbacteria bacterium RIFCSPHIGHO2_01_FULL_51_10]|uniref:EfeO-type cupredoxin-like domain-containing protein n=1 Tax=Candidatus Yonathbacteria bacterium RIFCSPHIGHO2_01_FULL_51_10 TaxID=1802723 RepID=A0A1G2S3T9_9BACT|nr:MAG: hypothetical protein A2675_04105 [Candidatus Yonathbacteria bacterium RIFCSPHIGHO2_01_FULL_51_10]